jgi:hypothetical protein
MPEPDFIFFFLLLKGVHNLESALIFFFIKKQTIYHMFYAEFGDHRLLEKQGLDFCSSKKPIFQPIMTQNN